MTAQNDPPTNVGSTAGLGALLPCPCCGSRGGYALADGDTFRWWRVRCNHCGADIAECRSDVKRKFDDPKPDRYALADAMWNQAGEYAERLRKDAERYWFLRDAPDANWRPYALRGGFGAAEANALVDAVMKAPNVRANLPARGPQE